MRVSWMRVCLAFVLHPQVAEPGQDPVLPSVQGAGRLWQGSGNGRAASSIVCNHWRRLGRPRRSAATDSHVRVGVLGGVHGRPFPAPAVAAARVFPGLAPQQDGRARRAGLPGVYGGAVGGSRRPGTMNKRVGLSLSNYVLHVHTVQSNSLNLRLALCAAGLSNSPADLLHTTLVF